MQCYRVAPDKEASRWMITIGNQDLEELFIYKDEAIAEAILLAKANSPSKIEICDEAHEVVDKRKY
ncbi:DUF2188 domain-containing protein [Bhargavaea cecembensis]|uniref:DUF2188 domain-containing protein n=1 Tax=Bhargavaea cecembensis TaxID=394098 RepID=UPI0012E78CAA|nr:DUF2188 domain-containing protein [Bhargavaea cecembensis]